MGEDRREGAGVQQDFGMICRIRTQRELDFETFY